MTTFHGNRAKIEDFFLLVIFEDSRKFSSSVSISPSSEMKFKRILNLPMALNHMAHLQIRTPGVPCPRSLVKTTSLPKGFPWVPWGQKETPRPKFRSSSFKEPRAQKHPSRNLYIFCLPSF